MRILVVMSLIRLGEGKTVAMKLLAYESFALLAVVDIVGGDPGAGGPGKKKIKKIP